MKLAIFTHVVHKSEDNLFFAYEPYIREMNLWMKHVSETKVIAPLKVGSISPIDTVYRSNSLSFNKVPSINFINIKYSIKSVAKLPIICFKIYKVMKWANHIHLRCPGNMGLLGAIIQIFFPKKPKTVKYAGNWDPESEQPKSYKFQKWLISNTFLTRNTKVLVYGNWPNQSKNIFPFFTATYSEKDIKPIKNKELSNKLKFIYVGALHSGKQPLLSIKVIQELKSSGYNVKLNMFGDGEEKENLNLYIDKHGLREDVIIHGNKSKDVVKQAYIEAHFLLFISKSEGWPKVVAEAMFWSCVPITSRVSCVPWMLGGGERGILVENNLKNIVSETQKILVNNKKYQNMSFNAQKWSQSYTLEKFDTEIQKLLKIEKN